MVRRSSLGAGVVAAATGLVLAAAGGAGAAPGAGQTNSSFAGYQVSKPSTHIKSAAATFVVPTITCKKNSSGVGPAVLVQSTVNKKTNTFSFSGGGMGVACQHKQPEYESIIDVDGSTSNDMMLAAGDQITVTVKLTKSRTKVEVNDVTSGVHKTRTGKRSVGATAYIGDSSLQINNVGVGLDPFTKIPVTGAEVNGKSLKAEKAIRTTWVRHHTVLVVPSALKKGKDFSLTFKHA